MTMDEFIDTHNDDNDRQRTGHDKEMYTLTYSQNFSAINVNAYINYTHRTYWNQPNRDSYNLTLSHYFDVGEVRGISLSVNGFRNEYDNERDDGVYVSLSIPWGNNRTLSYNGSFSDDNNSNQVGYYERIDDRNNYQINAGRADNGATLDGYYRYQASYADIDVSANYQEGDYTSGGLNIRGGATLTAKGGRCTAPASTAARGCWWMSAMKRTYPSPATARRYIPTRLVKPSLSTSTTTTATSENRHYPVAGRRGSNPLHRSGDPDGRGDRLSPHGGAQR